MRHAGLRRNASGVRDQYGNEAGIERAPKGLYEFKPRRIYQEKSVPGARIGPEGSWRSNERASAGLDTSVVSVSAQSFTKNSS